MPRARKITKSVKNRIHEFQDKGLSDLMISRALGISEDSVKKFKKKVEKTNGLIEVDESKKTSGKREGDRDPDPGACEDKKRESEYQDGAHDSTEQINFVGGKPKMNKTKNIDDDENVIYQCCNCSYTSDQPFDNCPECGAGNEW